MTDINVDPTTGVVTIDGAKAPFRVDSARQVLTFVPKDRRQRPPGKVVEVKLADLVSAKSSYTQNVTPARSEPEG